MPKILLVDDMTNFLDLEVSFLRRSDCQILTAADGVDALKITKMEKPDLVLLDIEMPRMSGIECCRILKSDPATKDIPVVMITATSRKEESIKAGADDFWQKPINEAGFLKGIQKFIEIKEREDKRVTIGLQVDYRIGDQMNKVVHAFTKDLSSSGMFLITRDGLPVGTVVDMSFTLPECDGLLEVKGKVVRELKDEQDGHHVGGMGLIFVDLPSDTSKKINDFIDNSMI